MSLLNLTRRYSLPLRRLRHVSTQISQDEYTETPQYPPILDLSLEKRKERANKSIWDEIKAVKTVEEKQIKINMPRYWNFKAYMLRDDHIPYNNLPLIQHVTRTHLMETRSLPKFYDNVEIDEDTLSTVQKQLEEVLLFELEGCKRIHDLKNQDLEEKEVEKIITSALIRQINRVILNAFQQNSPHLKDVYSSYDTRVESCWYAGGMVPTKKVKQSKLGVEWLKDKADDPIDRLMYYVGGATCALRARRPLLPIVSLEEAENQDLAVPKVIYDPRTVGIAADYKHMANIPGYWTGDSHNFGIMSYHNKTPLTSMSRHLEDDDESLLRQAILASFGWLSAQANLLGFNTFNDVTYPLVTQTVLTDGQNWSFFTYQLNTLLMHSKFVDENPRRNLCWATSEMKLYEAIKDSKLEGFNLEVLKHLLKFYANAPKDREGVNLTPYLSAKEKFVADYSDDEKRDWLEKQYKYLMSNRPRGQLPDEIYSWEKIYKIDHNTRFMDKKLRPFELKINPFRRRLNEGSSRYVPRALRPHLPKHKGRYANEYWP